jgi:hypothetical protein
MTPRDPELLDLLRHDPDLLAIVDAAQETMRPAPKPRALPRLSSRSFVALGGVLALGVAIVVLTSGRSGPGFDQRALAAVGSGEMVHVELSSLSRSSEIVTIRSGSTRPETLTEDYWFDFSQRRLRAITRRGNSIVADTTETIKGGSSAAGPVTERPGRTSLVDPTIVALVTDYRAALERKQRFDRGRAPQVYGRQVRWIDLASQRRVSVAVDLRTFRPIAIVARGTQLGAATLLRVTRFETLPPAAAAREQSNLLLAANSVGEATDIAVIDRSQLRSIVSPAAVWLGASIRTLPLRRTVLQRLTTNVSMRHGLGATLLYGSNKGTGLNRDQPFVVIREASFPAPAYRFLPAGSALAAVPAQGQLRLEREPRADRPGSTMWVAQLRRRGPLYLTIEASSRALILEAARALRAA